MSESISEKIAGILNAAPVSFDPEDDIHEETRARVEPEAPSESADEEDLVPSRFRRQNVDLLEDVDKRYEGKKSSRKRLLESDDWGAASDENSADSNESEIEDGDQKVEDESTADSDGSIDEDDNEDFDIEDDQSNFKHLEDSDTSHKISKGVCVRHQLSIWENLLEIRIQFQKCLLTANKFPQLSTFKDIQDKCGNQFTDKVSESKKSVSNLLDKFLELQSLLLRKFPETKKLLSGGTQVKTVESDEEIPSDTDDEQVNEVDENSDEETPRKKLKLSNYNAEIEKRHKLYNDYRNSVIQKWNEKTRIAPSKSGELVHSVTNQIDHILSDKEKLIKRTQLKRTDYEIVGQQKSNEDSETLQDQSVEVYDSNIFDDTDFYHHLLRELIEFKSADVTDPVQLGRQWLQLQNLRSKMKRKIDTRATKGRKIRYVVHSKLVNFMAPIEDNNNCAVTDLRGSLFGKNQVF